MLPSRRSLVSWALALVAWTVAPPAQASWPHDPNSSNVPICTAANTQTGPTIVSDGAGGSIITWFDLRSGNFDIYAQRLSPTGVPLWAGNGVAICTAAGFQGSPTLVSDGVGGAIIAWHDQRSGNYDIYAQRVNAAGVTQWAANGVALCTATGDQQSPVVVPDGAGGAIVTWADARSGSNDIYAQRVSAAGVPQWVANGVAVCAAAGDQLAPTVATDGAGGVIATWWDFRAGNYDIYAQRVSASGVPQWTANGVAVCTAVNNQTSPVIVPDGANGAILAWQDVRGGSTADIYAQHLNPAGAALWTANGVAVCTAAGDQLIPSITTDGAGGAIVAWYDARNGSYDIYAQRVDAAGFPQWATDGVPVCTAAFNQEFPTLVPDGAGGVVATWEDARTGINFDLYAQRVNANGVTQWAANGVPICTAIGDQTAPSVLWDGTGGAVIAWQDARAGATDIYAQRVDRFGYLGDPSPVVTAVSDVPNDQGGRVKVSWTASYLDADPTYGIYDYRLWRSVPPASLTARMLLARGATTDPDRAASEGRLLVGPYGATSTAWELVATQPAGPLPAYSLVAPTTSDSLGSGNPRTAFMVQAQTGTYVGAPSWFSAPDSGYSVDNLPPVAPAPFTGAYSAGATQLHWGVNAEPDLAGYRLYRGSSAGFTPGPGNLIAAQPDTGFTDVGPAGSYYKLSAVDVHGNESGFALLSPTATTGLGGGAAPASLALAAPRPNPARAQALLTFTLPDAGPVTLAVYDMGGRRIRTVSAGPMEAGEHALPFDLRDTAGRRIPSGLYFVRLEVRGRTLMRRLAITE